MKTPIQHISLIGCLTVLTAAVSLLGCGASLPSENPDEDWRYDGAAGPAHWGRLHPQFHSCLSGEGQSPISIDRALPQALPQIRFRYAASKAKIKYDGRLVRLEVPDGGEVVVARRHFALREVLLHSPSEHRLRGQSYPLEVQLVHEGPERTLFVISVFVDHGAERPELDWLWSNLPDAERPQRETTSAVNFDSLLPNERRGYRYAGSLTTPPCDEPVSWLIVEQPIFVSPDRIDRFTERYPPSQRPLQPAQNRPVLTDVAPRASLTPSPRRGRAL